ncbi:MAG: transglutaminase-like domain-containing protein [Phycisphaerales bacterium]|nr:transglutaminase-like domain-containing protein [Phycisphaerales bacterium]
MMKFQCARWWCCVATIFTVVVTVGCQRSVKVGSTPHDADVAFLNAHMPASEVDRVSQARLSHHANVMRTAWKGSPWQEDVDVTLWREAILPPTHVSERCEDWCDVLIERLQGVDTSGKTVKQAVSTLNAAIGDTLDVQYHPTKRRVPDQGPLETMELGWSSCTGLSILLANACRTRGIPARLAGTPLWVDDSGNHTWVEVWADGRWHHVEAADPNSWDSAWFDAKAAEAVNETDPMHRIYAVMPSGPVVFPLAWAPDRQDIHAVDVTDRYRLPTHDQ